MSCLFLLDRGKHSLSFSEYPDPSSVVWLDFKMLALPTKKFGSVNDIPWIELYDHIKTDISAVKRSLREFKYDTIVSSGRACLVHCELIDEGFWRGKNVFVDVSGVTHLVTKKLGKHNSIFVEASDSAMVKSEIKQAEKKGIHVSRATEMPIQSHKISEYIQDFFY